MRKLSFEVNGIAKRFNYIGQRIRGRIGVFYLEIENINAVDQIAISNKLLIQHFPAQENLIKSKVGQVNKSVLLNAKITQKL